MVSTPGWPSHGERLGQVLDGRRCLAGLELGRPEPREQLCAARSARGTRRMRARAGARRPRARRAREPPPPPRPAARPPRPRRRARCRAGAPPRARGGSLVGEQPGGAAVVERPAARRDAARDGVADDRVREAQLVRAQDARADQLVAHVQRALQRQLRERRGLSQLRILAERDEGARERRALGNRRHARVDRCRRSRAAPAPAPRPLRWRRARRARARLPARSRTRDCRLWPRATHRRARRSTPRRAVPSRTDLTPAAPSGASVSRRTARSEASRASGGRSSSVPVRAATASTSGSSSRRRQSIVSRSSVGSSSRCASSAVSSTGPRSSQSDPMTAMQPELARLDGLRRPRRARRADVLEHRPGRRTLALEAALTQDRGARCEQAAGAAEGMRALELAAAHAQREQAALVGRRRGRAEHRGLADAGGPLEQQRRAGARGGPVERLGQEL